MGFSIEKCKCILLINQVNGENEKELLSTSLIPARGPSVYSAEGVAFTFPTEGEYHINVSGSPIEANLFTPFEIELEEQVYPAGTNPNQSTREHGHGSPRLVLTEAALFTLLMGYFLFSHNKPKTKI